MPILSLDDRERWVAEHARGGLPSQSWEYAWGLSRSGAVPKLAVVCSGNARMLLPFVEREWQGTTDIATILGISGASIAPNSTAPMSLWYEFARGSGWVAGYIQLAVSVGLDERACPGRLVANNTCFLLDLRDELQLASVSQAVRRKIRHTDKSGAVLVDDPASLTEALPRLYPQTLRRVGAAPYFAFSPQTLDCWARSPTAVILGARIGTSIEAVYLCLIAGLHAEFHILGSTDDGRGLAAWLIWNGIPRLRERGVTELNLTGGMKPGDGLYRFKQGFRGTAPCSPSGLRPHQV
jgi:hypothetical protein